MLLDSVFLIDEALDTRIATEQRDHESMKPEPNTQ